MTKVIVTVPEAGVIRQGSARPVTMPAEIRPITPTADTPSTTQSPFDNNRNPETGQTVDMADCATVMLR